MSRKFQTVRAGHTTIGLFPAFFRLSLLIVLVLSFPLEPSAAQDPSTNNQLQKAVSNAVAQIAFTELPSQYDNSPVRIWSGGGSGGADTYVITHGMGGTKPGDRFNRLAAAIHQQIPEACILKVDWSERASANIAGFPNPWKVAKSINEVGVLVSKVLKQNNIDPDRCTFIGESFGNWVNAKIASELGGVHAILALNPANEAGGYRPPDLRKISKQSGSFHTYSTFDTTLEIAKYDFWLETVEGSTDWDKHVAGIHWLTARLEAGDTSCLSFEKSLPPRIAGHFQATLTQDGRLLCEQPSRVRPTLPSVTGGPETLMASNQLSVLP